jgi:hypothetical protein
VSGGGCVPASGGGKGRAGEMQWRMRKLMVLPVWGGRGQRGELHGGPSLAALMEGGGALARASRSGRPFYRHSG